VQIPRLHGKINNRLDKVLSIFNQTRVSQDSQHYLSLDEETIDTADNDMQPIFHRLMMAASNVEMRQDMNVEDEYYSIIKEQEGKLYGLEQELAAKEGLLAEKDGQLAEKDGQLHALIKMLLQAGQTEESIASSLGIDVAEVKRLTSDMV
jgi:predicted transposase YdaD